jgi:hypothetical protein
MSAVAHLVGSSTEATGVVGLLASLRSRAILTRPQQRLVLRSRFPRFLDHLLCATHLCCKTRTWRTGCPTSGT